MAISKKEENSIEQEEYENQQSPTSNENQNQNGNHPRPFKKRKKFDGPTPEPIDLVKLKQKAIGELTELAKSMGVENTNGLKKQNLIFAILQSQSDCFHLCSVFSQSTTRFATIWRNSGRRNACVTWASCEVSKRTVVAPS